MTNILLHKQDSIKISYNYWRKLRRLAYFEIPELLLHNTLNEEQLEELELAIQAIPITVDHDAYKLARTLFERLQEKIYAHRT